MTVVARAPQASLQRTCAGESLPTAWKVGCCSEEVSRGAPFRARNSPGGAGVRRHQAPQVKGHGLIQVDHAF